MSRIRKAFVVPAAIIVSLTLVPMLTACGNPLQNLVKDATGGQVDLGGSGMPKDFPAEVPVASGKVIFGAGLGNEKGKVWNVTIQVSGIDALKGITDQLTGAGFKAEATGDTTGDATTGLFTKDPYGVLVVVSKDDKNGFIANYTVTFTKPGS